MAVADVLYAICLVLLSLYGLNSIVLTWLYLRHRHDPAPVPPPPAEWPHVTVQLPMYNEWHTVERSITAAAALDYLGDRLEIQVLDDSTDATGQLAARSVERLREQGVNVRHITRRDRAGFKAAALAAGMAQTTGELFAVFDADFVPPSDFLRRIVPYFADEAIGCVQTRWGHLNREYSLFTQVQALGVDGHFVVEQFARSRAGMFINFNGTAGVWRRACVEDAGGWRGDTLTEDLDLSYRAQLRGWRIAYVPEVVVPAELPAQISAFKGQQARWAQGSIQTALKMLVPLIRSDQPWRVKLQGCLHLTNYLVHPLILAVVLLTLPMSFSRSWVLAAAPWLMVAAVGPPFMYTVAQIADGRHWKRRLRVLPWLVLLGMGLAVSNTWAVLKAFLGVRQGFIRTPKFAVRQSGDEWVTSGYALRGAPFIWAEMGLTAFALALLFSPSVDWAFAPWLLLYAGSFGCVAGLNLYQACRRRRWLATRSGSASDRPERILQSGRGRTRAGSPGRGR